LGRRERVLSGEVAYEVFGEDGPPVILVHGTPSCSYIWRRIVPALEGRYQVYVYDLLGFGGRRGVRAWTYLSRRRAGRSPNWPRRGGWRSRPWSATI
jgi:pimeloyl-ACP methyl ester carboxylesterase